MVSLPDGVEVNQRNLVLASDAVKVPCKPKAFTTVRLKLERPAGKTAKQ